jgi:hypothetical protein
VGGNTWPMAPEGLKHARGNRAEAICRAGGVGTGVNPGCLSQRVDVTLSEAVTLGLLRQGVRTFICVLGHGSAEVGEVLGSGGAHTADGDQGGD